MESPLPHTLRPDAIDLLTLGIHSGLDPTLLPPNQASFAVNASMRGGHIGTRPPIRKLALTYTSEDVQVNLRAIFQGAAFYRSINANPSCLLTSIGGRLFRWTVFANTVTVDDVTPFNAVTNTYDLNDPTRPQAWLAQGQDFMVIHDGQANPWFFDGSGTRRSRGYKGEELPPGKQITYNNGRFVQAQPDGISYIASDLVYNVDSGTPTYNYRDAILRIKDNNAILAGRAFGVPLNTGAITALYSVANPDSSLGQGPLQVGTQGAVYSTDLPLDATLWTTTQQPTQVVALPAPGPTGHYAITTVNGDAWYRAPDGLHSFVIARRDFNTWVQTPLSFEMDRILPYDTRSLLPYASAVSFDNRLLVTCSPYRSDGRGIAHRGLVALDFNNISSLTTRTSPAYDGLWTGLPILQVVKGEFNGLERCFAFAIDATNNICLYEIGVDNGGWFDFNGAQEVAIQSWVESNALYGRHDLPDSVTQVLKRLQNADISVEKLLGPASATPPGTVAFNLSYRSDAYPFWVQWHQFDLCALSCYTPATCAQPVPVQTQYAAYKRIPEPAPDCNPLTGRPNREGYYFQIKLSWAGHAQLHRLNPWVTVVQPTRNVVCNTPTCAVLAGCLDNPFTYVIELGPGTGGLLEWDINNNAPTWDVDSGSTITPL